MAASFYSAQSPPTDKLSERFSEHSDQRELGRKIAKQGNNARSWALSILHAYFMYSTNKHRRWKKDEMKDRNPYVNNISLPWHLRLRLKAQRNTLLYSPKNQTCNGQEKRNKQQKNSETWPFNPFTASINLDQPPYTTTTTCSWLQIIQTSC